MGETEDEFEKAGREFHGDEVWERMQRRKTVLGYFAIAAALTLGGFAVIGIGTTQVATGVGGLLIAAAIIRAIGGLVIMFNANTQSRLVGVCFFVALFMFLGAFILRVVYENNVSMITMLVIGIFLIGVGVVVMVKRSWF